MGCQRGGSVPPCAPGSCSTAGAARPAGHVDGRRRQCAIAAVVKEVAGGIIAPSEGQSLVAIMEAQRKAIETADIVARVEALEARAG